MQYLADDLHRVAEVESRLRLHSTASTVELIIAATAPPTIGDRAFFVAAARAWNGLPLSECDVIGVSSSFQEKSQAVLYCHLVFRLGFILFFILAY